MPAGAQAWFRRRGKARCPSSTRTFRPVPPVSGDRKGGFRPTTSRSVLVDVTYGLTDKLAVSFGFRVSAKYVGPAPHPNEDLPVRRRCSLARHRLDNGKFHGTLQISGSTFRYNLTTKRVGADAVHRHVGADAAVHDACACGAGDASAAAVVFSARRCSPVLRGPVRAGAVRVRLASSGHRHQYQSQQCGVETDIS